MAAEANRTDDAGAKVHPLDQVGCVAFFRQLNFGWLSPLLRLGSRRQLLSEDIWEVPERYSLKRVNARVEPAWARELQRVNAKGGSGKPDIRRCLWGLIRRDVCILLCLTAVSICLVSSSPLILRVLLRRLMDADADPVTEVLPLAIAYAAVFFCISHIMPQANFCAARIGCVMRGAVQQLIFQRCLSMSLELKQVSTASIVNLMSVDAERFYTVTQATMVIRSVPAIIFQSAILVSVMGWISLIAVVVFVASVPLQAKIGKRLGRYRMQMSKHTEERLRATNNFLTGIRSVKTNGWTAAVHNVVVKHRAGEVRALRQVLVARGLNLTIAFIVTPISAVLTLSLYASMGGKMSADRVFVAIAILRNLQMPLMILPMAVTNFFEFQVARQRVERFLTLVEEKAVHQDAEVAGDKGRGTIEIQGASFAWDPEAKTKAAAILAKGKGKGKGKHAQAGSAQEAATTGKGKGKSSADNGTEPSDTGAKGQGEPAAAARFTELKEVDLCVQQGQLVVVVGPTGSGKTSLLMAMLGEMAKTVGTVRIGGKIALAGQEPWIRSASLQENVLFKHPFDFERYDFSLRASALKADLSVLPDGDKTEIGERGINLSGGQKARVALARSLYRLDDCDVYVLDDTLSAVDSHVGQVIIESALLGGLSGKTRIVVLNTFLDSVLPHADRVVVMGSGCIEVQGSVQDCLSKSGWFRGVYDAQQEQSAARLVKLAGQNLGRVTEAEAGAPGSRESGGLFGSGLATDADGKEAKSSGLLYKEEERATGVLELSIYRQFFGEMTPGRRNGGLFVFLALLAVIMVAEAFRVAHDWMILLWVQNADDGNDLWIRNLVLCVAAIVFFGFVRAQLFMYVCSRISQHTHDRMLWSVLTGSVPKYFDVTPLGRILNRFSKDLDSLDMQLPMFMFEFLQAIAFVMGVIIVCAWTSYATLAMIIPLFYIFYRVRRYFSCTSRELKRLESVTRSPLYSLFTETIGGLVHLRAFQMLGEQSKTFEDTTNVNLKVFFHLHAIVAWLINRCDLLGVCMILSIGVSCLWLPRTPENAAMMGFGLTLATGLMGRLFMTVNQSIETENHMTSVERLQHFAGIPKEAADSLVDVAAVPEAWPTEGRVEFEDVCLRYRPGLPLVLDRLSFEVQAGERVGIVGRTGCGKSSTMSALLRIVESEEGCVRIDGIDLRQVPLQRLRGDAVTMIPQDPYLFGGSVRDNLDPFQGYIDDDLWAALKQSCLDDVIRDMGGLGAQLVDGGENLSAGQRQLVCIARAMLRRSKVVLMDEATANVDKATDALIQKAVREAFKHCTLLVIAHRLDTVLDSDRIFVLDAGRVVEQGPPEALRQAGGPFAAMVKRLSGDDASDVANACAVDTVSI